MKKLASLAIALLASTALAVSPTLAASVPVINPATNGVLGPTPDAYQSMINAEPWVNGRGLINGPVFRDNYQALHDLIGNMGTWSPAGVYTPTIGGLPPAASATVDATNADNIPKTLGLRQLSAAYIPQTHFISGTAQFQVQSGATYASGPAPAMSGLTTAADADGKPWHLKITNEVNPRWMDVFNAAGSAIMANGAQGDSVTDDAPAENRAFAVAKYYNVPVHYTGGLYNQNSQVYAGRVGFFTDGPDKVAFSSTTFNGSFFYIDSTGAGFTGNRYEGIHCQWGGSSSYTSTACIEIGGDAAGLFQYHQFRRIRSDGLYAGIAISKAGSPIPAVGSTPARSGGNVNWLVFDDIECNAFSQTGRYCIWYKAGSGGSGTGTVYSHLGGNIGGNDPTAAWLRFEGTDANGNPGTTVGDFIVSDSEFNNPQTIVSVGAGASYVNNMSLVGDQFDSAVTCPIHFDTPLFKDATLGQPQGIRLQGSNLGGGVNVGGTCIGVPLKQSIIPEKNTSRWSAGASKNIGGGATTTTLFEVDLTDYSGTKVTLSLQGLIQGLGSASSTYECSIAAGSGAGSAVVTCNLVAFSNSDGSLYAPEISIITDTSGTDSVRFSAVMGTGQGGGLEGQIAVSGGTFYVKGI